MKSNPKAFQLLIFSLSLWPVSLLANEGGDDQVGRYILVNRDYITAYPGKVDTAKELFLLDTVTGELKICRRVMLDGDLIGENGKYLVNAGCSLFEDKRLIDKTDE